MNIWEGMRRLALVLGIAGALVGGYASFLELRNIAKYREFRKFANSYSVRLEAQSFTADVQHVRTIYLNSKAHDDSQMPQGRENANRSDPLSAARQISGLIAAERTDRDNAERRLLLIQRTHSEIKMNGVRKINWTKDYGINAIDISFPWPRHLDIESIETEDGHTLFPVPSPSVSTYLSIVLLPMVGFLIPWGICRATGWIGIGFTGRSEE
jgi:hypothetical protein